MKKIVRSRMNRRIGGLIVAAALACAAFALVGCGSASSEDATNTSSGNEPAATVANTVPSGQISVYSREDGSGTRGAFVELFGIEQEDESGQKIDMTTPSAAITNSTSVMMTSIAGDENGIGYISLGSLNDTVKAVSIEGVAPSAETVKDGSYPVSRPFNIVVGGELSDIAQDFMNYILSADGQTVVEDNGYIAVAGSEAYQTRGLSGKVVVAGSSSVTPVMEKLAEAYQALNPDVAIEVQQSDSTTGVQMATEGTCDIGMASRELKDSEAAAGVESVVIAQDGIAVIVNTASSVDGLSIDQVMRIFTGEFATWEDALA